MSDEKKGRSTENTEATSENRHETNSIKIGGDTLTMSSPKSDRLRYLAYFFGLSAKGEWLSHKRANDALVSVSSTAYLSELKLDWGIDRDQRRRKSPKTGKWFTEYRMTEEAMIRAQKILEAHGYL